jgi:hypothetical protein
VEEMGQVIHRFKHWIVEGMKAEVKSHAAHMRVKSKIRSMDVKDLPSLVDLESQKPSADRLGL